MKKLAVLSALTLTVSMFAAGCGDKEEAPAAAPSETPANSEEVQASATPASDKETAAPASDAAAGGSFIVGFDQDFPPMGFVGDDGEFTGFDLEMAQEVAKRLGMEYVPQPIAWDSKDMELDAGTITCIWNGFTMNGREENYAWTDPYLNNKQVFVVREDSGIDSKEGLAGKVVDVQADSSAEAALNDDPELSGSFGQLQAVPDYNTAFMDLESGAVDAIAMDSVVADYQIANRENNFVVLDDVLATEEYGIAFKKDNTELRDKVQAILEEMATDGTTAEISTKWFGSDITTIGK